MNSEQAQQQLEQIAEAQREFVESGKHDLLIPLWSLCESGGFPSHTSPPHWQFEKGIVLDGEIHLQFRVHFMEESPACCSETPGLRPLSKIAYITRDIASGAYETYSDASIPTPNWDNVFHLTEAPPSYEDSFS